MHLLKSRKKEAQTVGECGGHGRSRIDENFGKFLGWECFVDCINTRTVSENLYLA